MLKGLLAASVVAAVAAVGVVGAGNAAPAGSAPLLGLVSTPTGPMRLARLAPETLQSLPGKALEAGSGGCARRSGGEACWTAPPWSFSPDGRLLALARNARFTARSLRLVDVEGARVSADVPLGGQPVGAVAWLTPRRVLAVQEDLGSQRLLAIDLDTRRVTARRALGGSVEAIARTPSELLLLVAPADTIGPARLVVVDGRGAVRSVRLRRLLAGQKLVAGSGVGHAFDHRTPGLAADPAGRRAFVVSRSLVAEVDLATLAVSDHVLSRPASFATRLGNGVEPVARTKRTTGFWRQARWLGGGFVAVSGTDSEADGRGARSRPAGLLVVDTRSRRVQTIDPGATHFELAGDLLLATGSTWDSTTPGPRGAIGLVGYGLDGRKRFALFDGLQASVSEVYAGRAYVSVHRRDGGLEPLRIVELASGRVIGERSLPLPRLLDGVAASWWET